MVTTVLLALLASGGETPSWGIYDNYYAYSGDFYRWYCDSREWPPPRALGGPPAAAVSAWAEYGLYGNRGETGNRGVYLLPSSYSAFAGWNGYGPPAAPPPAFAPPPPVNYVK